MLAQYPAYARTTRYSYIIGISVIALTAAGLVLSAWRSSIRGSSKVVEQTWLPPADPPSEYTAALVYLVTRDRMDMFVESLGRAQQLIAWHSQWPIILFHSGEFDSTLSQSEFYTALRKDEWAGKVYYELRDRITFEKLEWTFPPGVSPNISIYQPEEFVHVWPGYHHMCRFFADQIFKHPRIRSLTYYMRLDTDSYILEPLCYDPIDKVHRAGKMYGYNYIFFDEPFVVRKMWNFIDEYARAHPEIEARLKMNGWYWPEGRQSWAEGNETYDGLGVPSFYNNFEVVKVEAFQRPDVVAWINAIMEDPSHIYSLRWGDAPIRFTTVSMFYDMRKDVEWICAMNYHHNFDIESHCACEP